MSVAAGVFLVVCFWPGSARALSAPAILEPKAGATITPDTPLILRGIVPRNTNVFVFLDGKLDGGIKAKNGKGYAASFAYKVKKKLKAGTHNFQTQAVVGSEKSAYTAKQSFTIPSVWPRRTDGVFVKADDANDMPMAMMIENPPSVRPQSGLSSASVVYETLAEGGVPRLLAIFSRDDMPRVGPVRSARYYYVDWAKEYGAALFHAGGSPDGLAMIRQLNVPDVEALKGRTSRYFFRNGGGDAVHTLFTNSAKIRALKNDYGFVNKKSLFNPWKFKDELKKTKLPKKQKTLRIDFLSGFGNTVDWEFDRSQNRYLRFQGGVQQVDAKDRFRKKISAKNVIVQIVPKERVRDYKARIELKDVGQGRGWLLQDGKLHQIKWRKRNASGRTRYWYLDGTEVEFNRGTTWVEVVPVNRLVLYQ